MCSVWLQSLRMETSLMVLNSSILICFRNSTYCLKIKIAIKFVQHEPNLCYNAEAIFTQKLPIARDGQLVCPYLDFFRDEKHELPKIQWHKVILYYIWYFPFLSDKISFLSWTIG